MLCCTDARALDATSRLAAAFVAAAPRDPFFRKLAEVTRNALAGHFDGSADDVARGRGVIAAAAEIDRAHHQRTMPMT
jgi:hypothetical protein